MNTEQLRTLTFDQIFDFYKQNNPTIKQWDEILIQRTGVRSLIDLHETAKKQISYYDKSSDVNSFIYKDNKYWIDKDTRMSLYRLIESGATKITLQLDNIYLNISSEKLKDFLDKLEVYAGQCFTNTAKHLQSLQNSKCLEDLIDIKYTEGYPDKIELIND